jgi:molybdopterin converting factor small subunit
VKVWIPQPLLSYTNRQQQVEAEGTTLAALLEDLDRRYPGIRFRVVNEQDRLRPHVKFFVNREQVARLDTPLEPSDEVHIFQALSGG